MPIVPFIMTENNLGHLSQLLCTCDDTVHTRMRGLL